LNMVSPLQICSVASYRTQGATRLNDSQVQNFWNMKIGKG